MQFKNLDMSSYINKPIAVRAKSQDIQENIDMAYKISKEHGIGALKEAYSKMYIWMRKFDISQISRELDTNSEAKKLWKEFNETCVMLQATRYVLYDKPIELINDVIEH
jgi:cell fate (sporulation/competence/biofilm development) regulator YlbF (YheA/YmcA/DUF963 family)